MILDMIKPIILLTGYNPNASETGQGCFMNVVNYLSGETQVSDTVPSCYSHDHHLHTLRSLFIYANDLMVPEGHGHLLIPFIERAMGDVKKIDHSYNIHLLINFATWCSNRANNAAKLAYELESKFALITSIRIVSTSRAAMSAADAVSRARSSAKDYVNSSSACRVASFASIAASNMVFAAREINDNQFYPLLVNKLIFLFDIITPQVTEVDDVVRQRAEKFVEMGANKVLESR